MKDLVLKIKWGGLGDHLLYSPIPRVAKQMGYDHVYISNHSEYRNPDTKKLVWECNPYIDGFTNQNADYPKFSKTRHGFNIIDDIMNFYGVISKEKYQEPEIYWKPEKLVGYENIVIFDPNSINKQGIPNRNQIEGFFKKNSIKVDFDIGTMESKPFHSRPLLKVFLFQLVNLIYTCKHFYCLTTGSAALAAALRKPSTILYVDGINPMFHHSKLHTYTNIKDIKC